MRKLRWICGRIRRYRVWNDDLRERLEVAPVEEKFMQHHLRWFEHMQWRPVEAPIYNGVIRRIGNKKRVRGWPNLIWEESVKRDLKDWCITKELALDRREWKLAIYMAEPWSSVHFFYCLLSSFFPAPFSLFDLAFYYLFSFLFDFLSPSIFPFFALILYIFCSCGFICSLPQLAWE
jgi:hypothetical protein